MIARPDLLKLELDKARKFLEYQNQHRCWKKLTDDQLKSLIACMDHSVLNWAMQPQSYDDLPKDTRKWMKDRSSGPQAYPSIVFAALCNSFDHSSLHTGCGSTSCKDVESTFCPLGTCGPEISYLRPKLLTLNQNCLDEQIKKRTKEEKERQLRIKEIHVPMEIEVAPSERKLKELRPSLSLSPRYLRIKKARAKEEEEEGE